MDPKDARGRILKVKEGYNPNSSSVGSHIPAFLALALGAGLLSVLAANLLAALDARIRGKAGHGRDPDRD